MLEKKCNPKELAIELVKQMILQKIDVCRSRVLLLGLVNEQDQQQVDKDKITFYQELISYGIEIVVFEPNLHKKDVAQYGNMMLITHTEALEIERPLRRDHRFGESTRCFDAIVYTSKNSTFDALDLDKLLDFPSVVFNSNAF